MKFLAVLYFIGIFFLIWNNIFFFSLSVNHECLRKKNPSKWKVILKLLLKSDLKGLSVTEK